MDRIDAIRAFNRFYTRTIGVLGEGMLDSEYSLTEVRVLYELAHRERCTARELSDELGVDPAQLSRTLRRFEEARLIQREKSSEDARASDLSLTAHGRKIYGPLDARAREEIASLLGPMSVAEQKQLVGAMQAIESLLGAQQPATKETFILRAHRSGDMGWVVHRHGVLYREEYGWNEEFEALVAEIVAKFIKDFDPQVERCWIAERDGEVIGCVFVVKKSKTVAQLRCLLVEPSARGSGLGRRLVEECIRFAKEAGYRKMMLWTNSVLVSARKIYERAGFRLVEEERHQSWGHDLVGQNWEVDL